VKGQTPGKPTIQPKPAPEPQPDDQDPSQVTAVVAESWSDVKFAFCSAQGSYGVLIDFRGTNLSTTQSGTALLGVRPCDASSPFKWGMPVQFTGTIANGTLTLDFGTSLQPENCIGCPDDTIGIAGTPNQGNTGYGVMGGNSGPCVFLENKATGGDLFGTGSGFDCN
jgi:hypothetical protein